MNGGDTARAWVDGLLGTEEKTVGEDRAYPGAIAANFHVSSDDTGIFLLSEWASEAEALVHIKAEIEPLLEYMGQAEAGAGRRYAFHATAAAAG
jgi:quinol monooxygenase YgiN